MSLYDEDGGLVRYEDGRGDGVVLYLGFSCYLKMDKDLCMSDMYSYTSLCTL